MKKREIMITPVHFGFTRVPELGTREGLQFLLAISKPEENIVDVISTLFINI